MVWNMRCHMMVFLMNMAVKHGDIAERHQQFDRFRAVARRPIPARRKIKQRSMSEDHQLRIFIQRGKMFLQPLQLFGSD